MMAAAIAGNRAGLAADAAGCRLLVAANEADRGELLAWPPGTRRARQHGAGVTVRDAVRATPKRRIAD